MGHIGLTPQSVHAFGGFRVQARDDEAARLLVEGARTWRRPASSPWWSRGCPRRSGAAVTEALDVPTIGIGAGPDCDGQVLVLHDLLGVTARTAKFVRRYATLADDATAAVAAFAADVRSGAFPADAEVYH